jgi:hypothetical protein
VVPTEAVLVYYADVPSDHQSATGKTADDSLFSMGRDLFAELGVRTFINAAGTYTLLSASLMRPEVLDAMSVAAKRG